MGEIFAYFISSSSLCDFCLFCKCRSEQPVEKTDRQRDNWHPVGEGVHHTPREREPSRQLRGQGRLQGLVAFTEAEGRGAAPEL